MGLLDGIYETDDDKGGWGNDGKVPAPKDDIVDSILGGGGNSGWGGSPNAPTAPGAGQSQEDWDAEWALVEAMSPEEQYDRYLEYGSSLMPSKPGGSGGGGWGQGGGGDGGMFEGIVTGGKGPAEEYKQLWAGYVGFRDSASKNYTQNLSSAIVRMAAGGLAVGSQEWNATLDRVDTRYESALSNIEAGETYNMLKEYAKEQGTSGFSNIWYQKEFGGDIGDPNRYKERQAGVSQAQSKLVGGGITQGPSSSLV